MELCKSCHPLVWGVKQMFKNPPEVFYPRLVQVTEGGNYTHGKILEGTLSVSGNLKEGAPTLEGFGTKCQAIMSYVVSSRSVS